MELREYLKHKTLLFDGAMGTYFRARYTDELGKCELANCTAPERVAEIHKAYLDCGARAIKTNTFAANTRALECSFDKVQEVIVRGWKIAVKAAEPYRAFVFADIGPIADANGEYEQIVEVFLRLGAKTFCLKPCPTTAIYMELQHILRQDVQMLLSSRRLRFHRMGLQEPVCQFVRFYSV